MYESLATKLANYRKIQFLQLFDLEMISASAIVIVIDNLIVHYTINDATNDITIVTESCAV